MEPISTENMDESNVSFQLDQAIGMHVNRAAFLVSEEIARRFSRHGYALSAQDFGILFRLSKQAPMTQVEISKLMMRDKTTITRRIDGLVKKRWVERKADPKDRRYYRVSLTAEGKAALLVLVPLVSHFQQELLRDISEADKQVTVKTLKRISDQLIQFKTTGD